MPWKDYEFQQANYLNSQSVWRLESKMFGLTTVNEVGLVSGLVHWHQAQTSSWICLHHTVSPTLCTGHILCLL